MRNVLDGYIDKICLLWVEDIVIWGVTSATLMKRLLAFLDRLLEHGRFAGARTSGVGNSSPGRQ